MKTGSCVIVAAEVTKERLRTNGSIITSASPVVIEGIPSYSCVIAACVAEGKGPISHTSVSVTTCIGIDGSKPNANVIASGGIVKERLRANACAVIAADIVEQRLITDSGVLVAVGSVEKRFDTDADIPDSSCNIKERIVTHCRVLPEANTRRVWTPCV